MALVDVERDPSPRADAAAVIVYVCVTCRRPGDPPDRSSPGADLAISTARAAEDTGIVVRPLRCLANCTRGCSAVIKRADAWTYVFGHLGPDHATDLIAGARLLADAGNGLMPWRGRPEALKRGLIARVPPVGFQEQDT